MHPHSYLIIVGEFDNLIQYLVLQIIAPDGMTDLLDHFSRHYRPHLAVVVVAELPCLFEHRSCELLFHNRLREKPDHPRGDVSRHCGLALMREFKYTVRDLLLDLRKGDLRQDIIEHQYPLVENGKIPYPEHFNNVLVDFN